MTEVFPNPEDPRFLISRRLDGDLSAEEQRDLDRALAASPDLGRDGTAMTSVDKLLRCWAAEALDVDWTQCRQEILARIADADTSSDLARVDELLRRTHHEVAQPDTRQYVSEVMERVRGTRSAKARFHTIYRLAAPLAMAAAVVLAVGLWWSVPAIEPVVKVAYGPFVTQTPTVTSGAVTRRVMFGRDEQSATLVSARSGTGFIAVGAEAEVESTEAPPL